MFNLGSAIVMSSIFAGISAFSMILAWFGAKANLLIFPNLAKVDFWTALFSGYLGEWSYVNSPIMFLYPVIGFGIFGFILGWVMGD